MNKKRLFSLGLLGVFSSGSNGLVASLPRTLQQSFSVEKVEGVYNQGAPFAGGWLPYVAHYSLEGAAWSLGGFFSGPSQINRAGFGGGALLSLQLDAVEASLSPRMHYQAWGENWKPHVDADFLLRIKEIRGLESMQMVMHPAAGLKGPLFGINPIVPLKGWIGLPVNCSFLAAFAFGAPNNALSFKLDLGWHSGGKTSNLLKNLWNNSRYLEKLASKFYAEGPRIIERGEYSRETLKLPWKDIDTSDETYEEEYSIANLEKGQRKGNLNVRRYYLYPDLKKVVVEDPDRVFPRVYAKYDKENQQLQMKPDPILGNMSTDEEIKQIKALEAFRDRVIELANTSSNNVTRYICFDTACKSQPQPTLLPPSNSYGIRIDTRFNAYHTLLGLFDFMEGPKDGVQESPRDREIRQAPLKALVECLDPSKPRVDYYHEYQAGPYCQTTSINNYLGMHLLTPAMIEYLSEANLASIDDELKYSPEQGGIFPDTPGCCREKTLQVTKQLVESLGEWFHSQGWKEDAYSKVLRLLDLETWVFDVNHARALRGFLDSLEEKKVNRLVLTLESYHKGGHVVAMRKSARAGYWVLLDGNAPPIEVPLKHFLRNALRKSKSITIQIPAEISTKIKAQAERTWYTDEYDCFRKRELAPFSIPDNIQVNLIQEPLLLPHYYESIKKLGVPGAFREKRETLMDAVDKLPRLVEQIYENDTVIDRDLRRLLKELGRSSSFYKELDSFLYLSGRDLHLDASIKSLVTNFLESISSENPLKRNRAIRRNLKEELLDFENRYLDAICPSVGLLPDLKAASRGTKRRVYNSSPQYKELLREIGNSENRFRNKEDYQKFKKKFKAVNEECYEEATAFLELACVDQGSSALRRRRLRWLDDASRRIRAKACLLNCLQTLKSAGEKTLTEGPNASKYKSYALGAFLNTLFTTRTPFCDSSIPSSLKPETAKYLRGFLRACDKTIIKEVAKKVHPALLPASVREPYRRYNACALYEAALKGPVMLNGKPYNHYSKARY